MTLKSIAIIGVGAVGSIILHLIKDAPEFNIDIFATTERKVIITKENIEMDTGYTTKQLNQAKTQYDIIFICTKAYSLEKIVQQVESLTHKDTIIIICQNGYSQSSLFYHEKVYHAVVYISGQKNNNIVTYYRDYTLVLPINSNTRYLQDIFMQTHLDIQLKEDYLSQIWYKLLVNLGINSTTALTKNTAKIINVPEISKLIKTLLDEGIRVARTDGIYFNDDVIQQIYNIYKGYPSQMGTSMYYDTLNNQSLEYEFIQGFIYKKAKLNQIETPTLDIVYTLLHGYQYGR